jgi:hypothetical protein
MSGRPLRAFAMSALLALPLACLASLAQAGVGGGAGDVIASVRCATPVEKAQYYVFDDENYCWYDDGWQGAGPLIVGRSRVLSLNRGYRQ